MIIVDTLAKEIKVKTWQVEAAIGLLDEGATVPFIARYRKEVTGSLTDDDLRVLEERYQYLTELEERKVAVLKSIEEQGKLTPALKTSITEADNKARVEDLYAPFKPKRRTKAQIAIEAGLEPLATKLFKDPSNHPEKSAEKFLNEEKSIKTVKDALDGAKQILMEQFSEDADLLQSLRETLSHRLVLESKLVAEKENEGHKFKDYFDFEESIAKIPSHRVLAVLRGRKEGVLRTSLTLDDDSVSQVLGMIAKKFAIEDKGREADLWLKEVVDWTWKFKLKIKLDVDFMLSLKEQAEQVAIDVFKDNLKNLLMASPAGKHVVMGLDPGLRTGVKAVITDETGKLLEYTTIFPHAPQNKWEQSIHVLQDLCKKHKVTLVSIGNGTASRETDQLVNDLTKQHPDLKLTQIMVSEAGASVYSASKLASLEFPDLDVSYRGAVSIARRLQDPLAELVKIEPKAIGVGQYQHDVNQTKLDKGLNAVVEDCVNAVGADVNTASVPLLKSIAGLNETVAQNIIEYRQANGRFEQRQQLKKVPRLGEKTFEQAVGFLRILNGSHPLDSSSVHPERYSLVEDMAAKISVDLKSLIGNESLVGSIDANQFVSDDVGLPTIKDILEELKKPGRDPRPTFKTANFDKNVSDLKDLKPNMQLEGVVTNVTNFGAFVDVGVHQDGLVHVSELSSQFVKDPHQVVKVGQIVKVRVLDVDMARKRIQLSMLLQASEKGGSHKRMPHKPSGNHHHKASRKPAKPQSTGFGDALMSALNKN